LGFKSDTQQEALLTLVDDALRIKAAIPSEDYTEKEMLALRLGNQTIKNDDDAYAWLKKATQKAFIRKGERHPKEGEVRPPNPFARQDFAERLKLLEMHTEIPPPHHKHYDYAVILGATEPTVNERTDYHKQIQAQYGVTFDKTLLLGTDAIVDRTGEPEIAVMKRLFAEANSIEVGHIAIDAKNGARIAAVTTPTPSKKERANTEDTLIHLFTKYGLPQNSRILLISNQPHVLFQKEVMRSVAHNLQSVMAQKNYKIGTVGCSCPMEAADAPIGMDALARYIYESEKRIQRVAVQAV
jgi:hypothetical protein